jgi:linoleoyl-CoA desaturase
MDLLLYGLTYLFWVFYNDMKKYFTGKIAENTRMKPMSLKEHIIFWVTKVTYVAYLHRSYRCSSQVWCLRWSAMASWSSSPASSSLWCSNWRTWWRMTDFVHPPTDGHHIEAEWAIHQVNTTVNFATHNKVWNWLFGGLNFPSGTPPLPTHQPRALSRAEQAPQTGVR